MTADRDDRDSSGDVPAAEGRDDRPEVNPDLDVELDVDRAFAALVAQFASPSTGGANPWPDAENLSDDFPFGDGEDVPDGSTGPARGAVGPLPDAPPPTRDRAHPKDDVLLSAPFPTLPAEPAYPRELDDHYEPPEPPPLPRGDLVSRLAWAGVIGGPLFLLIAAMVSADLPSILLLSALAAFIGGFVTLVARMPGEPPEDGDDGAVV